jgi:hypothetical protein
MGCLLSRSKTLVYIDNVQNTEKIGLYVYELIGYDINGYVVMSKSYKLEFLEQVSLYNNINTLVIRLKVGKEYIFVMSELGPFTKGQMIRVPCLDNSFR